MVPRAKIVGPFSCMDLEKKIIQGLERLSDVFKTLLWEKAKNHGISPIQIQILIFVKNHRLELCNITQLAKEFSLTKPTVSDAVRVLYEKDLVAKEFSSADSRRYGLFLTSAGRKITDEIGDFTKPIETILEERADKELEMVYLHLTHLIAGLHKKGIIQVQRNCFSCRFYRGNGRKHFCGYLDQPLTHEELRLDCAEHDAIPE